MQVRRNSHLNCFNSVAMGFPVGLIVENDKGSQTQTAASEGTLKIQNVYMAGMTVLGSDVNKSFEDGFCDNGDKNSIDKSKESFSSTYFKSIASNKYFDAIAPPMPWRTKKQTGGTAMTRRDCWNRCSTRSIVTHRRGTISVLWRGCPGGCWPTPGAGRAARTVRSAGGTPAPPR